MEDQILKLKKLINQNKPKLPLPKKHDIPKVVRDLAQELISLTKNWNPVEIYTPSEHQVILEKEKLYSRFLQKKVYNPTFKYDIAESLSLQDTPEKLNKLKRRADKIIPKSAFEVVVLKMLQFKIEDDTATADLIKGLQSKNENLIAQALNTKYPGPGKTLLEKEHQLYEKQLTNDRHEKRALLTIAEKEKVRSKIFEAQEIKDAFLWALRKYGISKEQNGTGFKVTVNKETSFIDVRDKSKEGPTIFIPENKSLNGKELLKLIAHEIEGHARQSVNGSELFFVGGGALKIDEETMYEGLGMRYENVISKELFGEVDIAPATYHYPTAIEMARNGHSFFEVFEYQVKMHLHITLKIKLQDQVPELQNIPTELRIKVMENAWRTTFRVMRGHLDTTNKTKFAMAKDLAYLRGFLMDQTLVKHGLGYLNEAAIIPVKALPLLAQFDIEENDLPLPFKNVAAKYYHQVLKKQLN